MRRYLIPVAVSLSALAAPLAAATPAEQLSQVFRDSDEALLKRQPLNALFRGDLRYADQLGDFFSDAASEANFRADKTDLAALARIDRTRLNATDRIAYDTFKRTTEIDMAGLTPAMRRLRDVRPIDHFFGVQTFYPDLSSGQGAAPFKTVADYENNIKRHRQFAAQLDVAIARFREGMKTGVVQPKLIVRNVIDQLDLQLKGGVEGSAYVGPLKNFPDSISAADRARLTAETTAAVRDAIFPAYTRLRDFLRDEYLPVAREGVGLVNMPGGLALYRYLIESNTTLPMTPDQIHNLGLSEVARITREMEAIKTKVGFTGTLPQFFDKLRADPAVKFKSKDEMRDEFLSVGKRVDLRVREQFSTIPKTPLEIRAVPEYREKTDAGGSYNQGTPDGSRPGVFYYNSYDLPSRSKVGSETLYLHEAVPGHHFQISLAQENTALPSFMRFGGNTAYVEGWALYAETLWPELGMETDPYQRFGGLDDEMLRALRLVVDSGLHAKKWTRDQAIEYMLAHSGMSRTDATIEVERYIAIPGQALAYKIGQLTILKLKAEAKAKLGDKFDAKKFHAQVLMTGALPMTVLEAKVRAWIAGDGV
ncbi:DUF885 family protein [Sphingomonas sp. SUN039]|uniref:DUF885 domain-containing protein n=1 Tax=Sphingomonas sp. SUN039 TaxID=2937787 RepID=UPI002164049C|nr:DUF885 domain-containing protein [Sphingomonas sp. SUN039]UVO55068.1 DUF885 domain-containing protein [Sphingomonas sp. SUN039]